VTQPGQRPVTTWVYKPEAANRVWSSWWWAVCRSKDVEPSINFGIINSITRLHLVGYFCWFILRCTDPWILNFNSTLGVFCLYRISCVHHQEDHLYTQLGTVCLSYIYVSSLAGGWICSILEFLPQPHWVLYTECTGCVDIFSLLICSEILKRFEDGSDVISIFDTFKLIGKYVEYTAK